MAEPTKINNPTGKPELDDIFAEEDDKTMPIPLADTNQIKDSVSNQPVTPPTTTINYGEEEPDTLGRVRKYLVVGSVALLVVAAAAGIYWYRQSIFGWAKQHLNFFNSSNTPAAVNNQIKPSQNTNQTAANNTSANNSAPAQVVQTTSGETDSDGDGLADTEEKTLGTNPKSVDTDSDGLFDREEVKVYHTNPLNPDTDGDGHKDGDEVRMRFNPRGAGTLNEMK